MQQHHHHKGRQHHKLALGEIDGARGLPKQGKAQRRQRVDAARGQTAEEELKKIGHRCVTSQKAFLVCPTSCVGIGLE